jgi:hypothetical protein
LPPLCEWHPCIKIGKECVLVVTKCIHALILRKTDAKWHCDCYKVCSIPVASDTGTVCESLQVNISNYTVLGIMRETKAMRVCLVYITHLQTVCFRCVNFELLKYYGHLWIFIWIMYFKMFGYLYCLFYFYLNYVF